MVAFVSFSFFAFGVYRLMLDLFYAPEIQTLLTAVTSISLYCQQLKLGPTCTILTKYYQPNEKLLNVYGISNGTLNGTLLRSLKTDSNLQLYYPDYQYISEQKPLLHTFERTSRVLYSVYTYSTGPKLDQGSMTASTDYEYDLCFSNLNQFYCILLSPPEDKFVVVRQPNKAKLLRNMEEKLKFYAHDYCTSSLVFESDNDMYLINLYNLVDITTAWTKIPKSNYSISFCLQDGGRLKSSPMFLTTFAKFIETSANSSKIGLIDFEVCDNADNKNVKVVCPPGKVPKNEKEEGFFENTGNLIWTVVCGIGLIVDIVMIVITVIYYVKSKETKKVREIGTESYMGMTASQSPTAQKMDKGKVPPPPPKQLEMTTPTIGQSQESTKPQSTVLKTIE